MDQGVALPDAGEKSKGEGTKPRLQQAYPAGQFQQQLSRGLAPKPIRGQQVSSSGGETLSTHLTWSWEEVTDKVLCRAE